MRWSKSAEQALSKVPFFVRRRVRRKVEEEADRQKAAEVTLDHVRICQQKFLKIWKTKSKAISSKIVSVRVVAPTGFLLPQVFLIRLSKS